MQVCYAENKMGNGRRVADFPHFDLSADCFHAHLAFKSARFNAKVVVSELPKVKAQAYHYGKLGMDAGKLPGDDCVECPHNRQFPVVLLRKVTECKKLYFNLIPRIA